MSKRILIDPVTRIEGHAKISIDVDDAGKVTDAHFHIIEFRGFEKICEGRPIDEMPGLMARVCGICPVSHALASSKAGDRILGVDVPIAAVKQRRLASYAQILQSHALSFFHLSSPDLLVGLDAEPSKRNIFAMLDDEPDFVKRGVRLRKFGQRTVELVGGKTTWHSTDFVFIPAGPRISTRCVPGSTSISPSAATPSTEKSFARTSSVVRCFVISASSSFASARSAAGILSFAGSAR